MLTAAVCGAVFASPPSSNILYAIRITARISPGGVLVLIPNYTGDILNFGLAVELARSEGLQVSTTLEKKTLIHSFCKLGRKRDRGGRYRFILISRTTRNGRNRSSL